MNAEKYQELQKKAKIWAKEGAEWIEVGYHKAEGLLQKGFKGGKLYTQKRRAQMELSKKFHELGIATAHLLKGSESQLTTSPEIQKLAQEIQGLEQNIAELEQEISRLSIVHPQKRGDDGPKG